MAHNDNSEQLVWTWIKMAVTDCNNLKQRIIINNICLFLAQQTTSGPRLLHSRGF